MTYTLTIKKDNYFAEDNYEKEKVENFIHKTCGCSLRDGFLCSNSYNYEDLVNYQADMFQLSSAEFDLVV